MSKSDPGRTHSREVWIRNQKSKFVQQHLFHHNWFSTSIGQIFLVSLLIYIGVESVPQITRLHTLPVKSPDPIGSHQDWTVESSFRTVAFGMKMYSNWKMHKHRSNPVDGTGLFVCELYFLFNKLHFCQSKASFEPQMNTSTHVLFFIYLQGVCIMTTAFLHFFFLASFCWVLTEAWQSYMAVTGKVRTRLIRKRFLCLGWGKQRVS